MDDATTTQLQQLIARLRAGDNAARWELLERAYKRLRGLTSQILGDFPHLRQVDDLCRTTDVADEIKLRLTKALMEIQPNDVTHFFRLAAQKTRWLLLDLVKRYPRAVPAASAKLPGPFARRDYPKVIDTLLESLPELPQDEYAVLDLEITFDFTIAEMSATLGVDEKTIRRRRRRAYESLAERLRSQFPGLRGELAPGQE